MRPNSPRAWDAAGHTRFQLPDIDVNRVLKARYITGEPVSLTRDMLWDLEVRKAASPASYIPFVVRAGSDHSWNRRTADAGEYLDRCSMQRLWLSQHVYELILERAFLNHDEQKVTFHVEHSVGGATTQPLNRWRIVFLTSTPDSRLAERFQRMAQDPWLPEHTEIYIRSRLGIQLNRRGLPAVSRPGTCVAEKPVARGTRPVRSGQEVSDPNGSGVPANPSAAHDT